ncbi:MAG: hypothetical protein F7C32_01475 [Desulfurococcales archaeon]|nr:hypothetical protein [Desulfurococcales archaeon]
MEDILPFKIEFLACDSMGVRAFSFTVDMDGYVIHVDPGASLAPRRYGLPPHILEIEELEKRLELIRDKLSGANSVFISHYHFDHYLRGEDAVLYKNKILYVKDPRKNINFSQRKRSYALFKYDNVKDLAAEINIADSSQYILPNGAKLEFSPPVWHGEKGTKLGYVIMMKLEYEGYRLVYTSDVQGPMVEETLDIITKWKPHTLIVGGPPVYLAGYKTKTESVKKGLENLALLASQPQLKEMIIDHHLLRSIEYREMMPPERRDGLRPVTCAEYSGVQPNLLEARRRELWEKESQ